jgi:hypothetical protein
MPLTSRRRRAANPLCNRGLRPRRLVAKHFQFANLTKLAQKRKLDFFVGNRERLDEICT